jgi:hypothetical protein
MNATGRKKAPQLKPKPRKYNFLTWIIHESRVPQMRGAGDEAVALHRESAAIQQFRKLNIFSHSLLI